MKFLWDRKRTVILFMGYSRKPHIESSFLIDNLEAGAEYYLRIKSVANGKESIGLFRRTVQNQ